MSAVATKIINDVATRVETLFSLAAGAVQKRKGDELHPILMPGDKLPLFVVSGNDDIKILGGTARKKIGEYEVTVSYLTTALPGEFAESDDPRTKQEAICKRFDQTKWAAVAEVSQSDPTVLKPFMLPFADKKVSCAAVKIRVETYEARN